MISVLDLHGKINENAPEKYRGLTVSEARKAVLADLTAAGLLVEEKDHVLNVGHCQRCDTVVEPLLSLQWFVKTEPLAKPAIEAVESGKTKFVPEMWTKTYMHWMTNIKDWCISRQLWWGHRIPVWYDPTDRSKFWVARTQEEAFAAAGRTDLVQDEDVLDTWFSSALWPFSTLGWPEMTKELKTFYPTSVMETGYDILFFWVARMMMMGLHFMKKVPFRTVYLHAIVVDENGEKMSKVKGNVIDPLDVIYGATLPQLVDKAKQGLAPPQAIKNIEKNFPDGIPASGADALRFTLASMAAQGRNLRLSIARVEGYRHFANKLWNAARFAQRHFAGFDADRFADALRDGRETASLGMADRWILSRLQRTAAEVDTALEAFRINEAAQVIYRFLWTELCDWYIELVKPVLYGEQNEVSAQKAKRAAQGCLALALESACRLLHPFMPFITEEIWQQLPKQAGTPGSIMITMYPVCDESLIDEEAERVVGLAQELAVAVRGLRAEYSVPPSQPVDVTIRFGSKEPLAIVTEHVGLLRTAVKIGELQLTEGGEPPAGTVVTILGDIQVCVHLKGQIDVAAESARIQAALAKAEKERVGIAGRLANAAFVDKAPPAVVEKEREKIAEIDDRRARLQQSLERLAALS
jgi:valyl-tRNA synthetase